MLTLEPMGHRPYADDVSFIRADPRRPVLLMNDGPAALRALDIERMAEHRIDYSRIADEFLIYSWLVDLSGRCSLLLSADRPGFGLGIDHASMAPFRFELPPDFPHLANICWTDPEPNVLDVEGRVWTLQGGRVILVDPAAQASELQQARAALARRYAILSHDWESGALCVLDGEHRQLGVVRTAGEAPAMVEGTGAEIGAAYWRGHLLVCTSEGIDLFHDGERRRLLQPQKGWQMFGIATGPWHGGGYLAVASGSMDARSRAGNAVDVYALRP